MRLLNSEEKQMVVDHRHAVQVRKALNVYNLLSKEHEMATDKTPHPDEFNKHAGPVEVLQTQDNPADLAYYSDENYAKDFRAFTVHFVGDAMSYPVGCFFKQPGGDYAGSLEVFMQPKATWLPPVLVGVYKNWDAVTFIRN